MTRSSVTDDQYGKLWRRLEEIARRVREGTLSFPETMTVLQGVVEGTVQQTAGVVRLFVDYIQPLSDMIRVRNFDWINNYITETNFPITKRLNGEVEMKVFSTEDLVGETRSVRLEEVIQALEKKGWRVAEIPEGMAYAKAYPDEQRKHPIVILGSVWRRFNGLHLVPYLDGGRDGRILFLGWFEGAWLDSYRFLGVRK